MSLNAAMLETKDTRTLGLSLSPFCLLESQCTVNPFLLVQGAGKPGLIPQSVIVSTYITACALSKMGEIKNEQGSSA